MDNLAWLGDATQPIPQAPARYQAPFVGLNPALFTARSGPSQQAHKEALLNAIFSPAPNLLNQLNRIGGAEVPLYDSQLQYDEVFRNAGYNELASALLGLGAGGVEPGPAEFKAVADLLPMLAVIGRLPPRLAEELMARASPVQRAIFGADPADWQTFHGTPRNFGAPHSDYTSMGRTGRGYYLATDENLQGRQLHARAYGDTLREDTAILENPFVVGSTRRGGEIIGNFGEGGRQLARPNVPAMRQYRESLAALLRDTKGQYNRNNVVRIIDKMDEFIAQAERGEPIAMSFSEFRSLTDLPEMTAPSQIRSRGMEGGTRSPVNYTAQASDAFGFDGVISLHNDELVAFRPEHTVIHDQESALRRLQELGITLEELQALLPEGTGGF